MNSYGLVFGGEKTSHDSGNDITYQVVTGNNYSQVVIEGDEYILPKEAMQSEKVYDFVDKLPIEMLDEIKRSENVFIQFPNLRQGDMVVCKNSVRNDDLHTIKGTAKEIGNYLQGLSACRMYAKGGYISGELANGGGVEDESQLRLLTPMPPTKLGKTGIDSLTEIVGKDEMRPALSGALYAGNGIIVATDAHILVVLENQNYPKSLEGTIKSLWNKVPQENLVGVRYPTWEVTIPSQQNFQTKELSIDDVLAYAYGGFLEGKKIIKEKDFNKYQKRYFKYVLRLNIGNIEIGVDSLLLTRILRTLKANDVRKIVFHIGETNQRPIKITTDNKHYGLIMPVMIADKVEDLGEAIYVSQQIFYPISEKDFRAMSKKYGEYLTEFSKMVGGERMAEGGEITMNMPLLIRVLELAKEDVKEDKEIHFIAERLQSIADKGTLTMEDYDYISGLESNDKIQKLIAENDSNDSNLRFEQGGGVLLAPNGKPSNLTPEQWHLVRTPEFKAWFGDWEALENAKTRDKGMDEVTLKNLASNVSKVVDENGEPLVLYHGTKAKFNVFKTFYEKNYGSGIDFEIGTHFGTLEQAQDRMKWKRQTKGVTRIIQAFLNIKNLVRVNDTGQWIVATWKNILNELNIKTLELNDYPKSLDGNEGTYVLSYLKDNNLDGFIYKNKYEGNKKDDSYIVFEPNQIKLADGSNTNFDANNPDIRFEQGGGIKKKSELLAPNGKPSNLTPEQWHLVRTPEFKAWFGDWENDPKNASKVSGITKEPTIWYHSTKSDFLSKKGENTFKNPPFFFALRPDISESIVRVQHQQTKNLKITTKTFFVRYKNTFDLTRFNILSNAQLKKIIKKNTLLKTDKEIRSFQLKLGLPNNLKNTWSLTETKEVQDWIKNNGYDSFIVYEDGARNLAVFEPNSIKLADGTNTTFDTNNPDIRYAEGGLIAPNGNPSNLTPEQWHLVRTPEFKAWFGDWEKINGYNFYKKNNGSRVIEFNGLNAFNKEATYEPLVVYHTTNKDFNKFSLNAAQTHDVGYYGRGFYFGLEPLSLQRLYGGKAKPYFLSIQNPFIIDEETPREFAEKIGVYIEDIEPTEKNSEDLRNKLIEQGYDGVIALNNIWGIEIVAFYPEQIKLADGSNTKFDSNNPDIRFEKGGGFSYL